MSLKEDIYTYMSTNAGIIALTETRIYPNLATSRATFPYITFERIDNRSEHHMLAASKLARATYEISCWSDTAASLDAVAEAVRNAFDGFIGVMGSTIVRRARVEQNSDDFIDPTDGSQEGTFGDRIDVSLWFVQSVPVFP